MIYSESDLIIPVLTHLSSKKEGVSTSELIKVLEDNLKPTGKDKEILNKRKDTHFSQKVRNIVSHKKTKKGIFIKGFAKYKKVGRNGIFQITPLGLKYIEKHIDGFDFIISNGFTEKQRKEIIDRDFLNLVIEEGYITSNHTKTRIRSSILVERAKKYFTIDGKIYCNACKFNFEDFYGVLGKGFIEIHHLKPIFTYEDNFEQSIEDALKNVAPVCSNCHRMIHRKRSNALAIDTLREIIVKQKELT